MDEKLNELRAILLLLPYNSDINTYFDDFDGFIDTPLESFPQIAEIVSKLGLYISFFYDKLEIRIGEITIFFSYTKDADKYSDLHKFEPYTFKEEEWTKTHSSNSNV